MLTLSLPSLENITDEKKVVIDILIIIIMIGLFTVLEVSALFYPLVTFQRTS